MSVLVHRRAREEKAPAVDAGFIVEARSVEKVYDTGAVQVHALRGVDLAVERGEMPFAGR